MAARVPPPLRAAAPRVSLSALLALSGCGGMMVTNGVYDRGCNRDGYNLALWAPPDARFNPFADHADDRLDVVRVVVSMDDDADDGEWVATRTVEFDLSPGEWTNETALALPVVRVGNNRRIWFEAFNWQGDLVAFGDTGATSIYPGWTGSIDVRRHIGWATYDCPSCDSGMGESGVLAVDLMLGLVVGRFPLVGPTGHHAVGIAVNRSAWQLHVAFDVDGDGDGIPERALFVNFDTEDLLWEDDPVLDVGGGECTGVLAVARGEWDVMWAYCGLSDSLFSWTTWDGSWDAWGIDGTPQTAAWIGLDYNQPYVLRGSVPDVLSFDEDAGEFTTYVGPFAPGGLVTEPSDFQEWVYVSSAGGVALLDANGSFVREEPLPNGGTVAAIAYAPDTGRPVLVVEDLGWNSRLQAYPRGLSGPPEEIPLPSVVTRLASAPGGRWGVGVEPGGSTALVVFDLGTLTATAVTFAGGVEPEAGYRVTDVAIAYGSER